MDCRTARLLFEFACPRPAELDQQEAESLESHLRDCCECAQLARAEHEADEHLALAIQNVAAPDGLRDRIRKRTHTERRSWYRRRLRDLAAAAVVLLIAGVGVGYWFSLRQPVDVTSLADSLAIPESSADQVEAWFLETHGVKTVLPRFLKYQYFLSAGRQEFQGKLVPHLLFVRNQEFAEVWVLTADQFDLKASLAKARQAGSGRIAIEIRENPSRPEAVAYLFLYSGGSLEWLINPGPPPA